jgi:methylthioribose-1-phosphate isomerase
MIDQTRLPAELVVIHPQTVAEMWDAIKKLKVRGAPAIGVAAALGLYLAVKESNAQDKAGFAAAVQEAAGYLASSRPTAVNLFWALKRVQQAVAAAATEDVAALKELVLKEALAIRDEDEAMCRAIGEHGAALLNDAAAVLTHCNAGTRPPPATVRPWPLFIPWPPGARC